MLTGCALVCVCLLSELDGSVARAVEANTETLDGFEPYYLKVEQYLPQSYERIESKLVRSSLHEVWRSGLRYRMRTRMFYVADGSEWTRVDEPHGRVTEFSSDALQVRNLRGWDSEHPVEVPLNWGRSAKNFSEIKGSLSVADPTAVLGDVEAFALMWKIAGLTLKEIAAGSELVPTASAKESVVRLRLVSSDLPELTDYIGMLVDVDLLHGGLICRVERALSPEQQFVTEVVQFEEVNGRFWLPAKLRTTMNGKEFAVSNVVSFSINESLADEELQVQFPEGSQVHDVLSGKVHIWGTDQPEQTFEDHVAFKDFLYARAREYQNSGGGPPPPGGQPRWLWIVLANVVLVSLLIFFTYMRRRLSSPKTEA